MHWLHLAIGIVSEVIATSALKASEGVSRWIPSAIVAAGYLSSFYFLSRALNTIPIAVAYSVWSGVGVVLVSVIGIFIYNQSMTLVTMSGIGLILVGVFILQGTVAPS
jgi:small multidrug resistance pump